MPLGFQASEPCAQGIICLLIDSGESGRALWWCPSPRTSDPNEPMQGARFFPGTSSSRPQVGPLSRLLLLAVALLLFPTSVLCQSLGGSTASLDRQTRAARAHDFTYLESPGQVERFVRAGYLVPVRSNGDFQLHSVSYPSSRPETRTFILRLSSQYRRACGEKLVVTSLTRPLSRQPRNASDRSVHPTGMALDVRRSNSPACRSWLESVLLSLEGSGVLEATRERQPPHYHIAVYPDPYARYVAALASRQSDASTASGGVLDYQVRRGDSLWDIAQAHGITVDRLKAENNLQGSRIYAGQRLRVPVRR